MRKFILIFFILFFGQINAQIQKSDIDYVAPLTDNQQITFYRIKNGKTGLITSDSIIITQPIYEYVHVFSNNFAEVGITKNKKMFRGVINNKGEIVIPISYDYLFKSDEFIVVEKDGKQGVFNFQNEQILPLEYETIRNYDPFIVLLKQKKAALFTYKNNKISDFIYDDLDNYFPPNYISLITKESTLVLNEKGEVVFKVPKNEKLIDIHNQKIIILDPKTNISKLIDFQNKALFDSDYATMVFVKDYLKVSKNKKSGLIDYQNKNIIPIEFDYVWNFSNDFYIVLKENKYGIYKKDEIFLPINFKKIIEFKQGFLFIENEVGNIGIYDSVLNNLVPPKGQILAYHKDYYLIKTSNGLEIFNCQTQQSINLDSIYKEVYFNVASMPNHSFFVLLKNNKYGAVNGVGDIVIPFEYDSLEPIYDSKDFIAKKDGKYGIVTENNVVKFNLTSPEK